MVWNNIAAKNDPDLRLDVYYLRANILGRILSPLSAKLFIEAWDSYRESDLSGLSRSRMSGIIISDLIRALALEEIEHIREPESGWFVHSGVTTYGPHEGSSCTATISLENGDSLQSIVRDDCMITATATTNMRGVDDVSFIVGRLLSNEKFDLVAAGYRSYSGAIIDRGVKRLETLHSVEAMTYANDAFSVFPSINFGFPDKDILNATVLDTTEHFADAVRNKGAWSILYKENGQPAHETRHQALFCNFAAIPFRMLGIMVHPGADHGSGPTDLTLTRGNSTHIVEFKKDVSRSKVLHGLEIQLPRYMESVGAQDGTYIVACHDGDPARAREWVSEKVPAGIRVGTIDCRKRVSASKA